MAALTAIHRGGAINAELLDPAISVAAAQFSDSSNGRDFWTERLDARDERIALTWYKCFHAVSTAGVSYLAGLTDGGARPAVRSSAMIWRKFSMPSSVKAATPSSPKP